MDILKSCLSTFNNASDVVTEFITLKDHDQFGGAPGTNHVQVFFMERALGLNPDYDALASGLIKHQEKQRMPVTVRDEPYFSSNFLRLCDKYIAKLEYTNPHAKSRLIL